MAEDNEPKLLPKTFIDGVKAQYGAEEPCTCLWVQRSEVDADGVVWMVNDPAVADPLCALHPNGLDRADV